MTCREQPGRVRTGRAPPPLPLPGASSMTDDNRLPQNERLVSMPAGTPAAADEIGGTESHSCAMQGRLSVLGHRKCLESVFYQEEVPQRYSNIRYSYLLQLLTIESINCYVEIHLYQAFAAT